MSIIGTMTNITAGLNPSQKEAVKFEDGACLSVAIPGSGKTRVLTHRIAYLIREKNVNPASIMALTFTNKAANEMKKRISELVGKDEASKITASTFHSSGARILRAFCDLLGYGKDYVIYDQNDSKTLYKRILKERGLDDAIVRDESMDLLDFIEKRKRMLWSEEYVGRVLERDIYSIYSQYQDTLAQNNAMDFGDLLFLQLKLFDKEPKVQDYLANQFKYVLVDEYQDVNDVQYELIKRYSSCHKNVFVVGDPNQAIYSWRGFSIQHILSFEKDFKDCEVINLDKNYRSTKNILNSAEKLISHNKERKDLRLRTDNETGDPIEIHEAEDDTKEAEYIANTITDSVNFHDRKWNDHVILYRVNAMSRQLEIAFRKSMVPYKVVGSLSFFDRKEIRDVMAYLKFFSNHDDSISFSRIANTPRRNIGAVTVGKVERAARSNNVTIIDVLKDFGNYTGLPGKRAAEQAKNLADIFESVGPNTLPDAAAHHILKETGYLKMCEDLDIEEETFRHENVMEFLVTIKDYCEKSMRPTMSGFLQKISLMMDQDQITDKNVVNLMTIHAAKGLEFPVVFVVGLEENVLPHVRSLSDGDVEEERRLCFVAMTRAEKELFLTRASSRKKFTNTVYNAPSRFLYESGLLEREEEYE